MNVASWILKEIKKIFLDVERKEGKEFLAASFNVGDHVKVIAGPFLDLAMISEAAVSGKPIFVAHMQPRRNNYRFRKFFQLFKELGITRNLGDKVESWTYNSFNEAERIATMVHSKLSN